MREFLSVLALGAFWGLSPAMARLMGLAGLPVTHVLAVTGILVGVGLEILRRLKGGKGLGRTFWLYGLGCGFLINIPFAMSLWFARVLPISTYSLVISTAPFFSYGLALALGRERPHVLRLAALVTGFSAAALLILTRGSAGQADPWLLALSLVVPFLYACYHLFAAMAWPKGMDGLAAGVTESFASAGLALPFLLVLDPPPVPGAGALAYGLALITSIMWVAERIAFFWLIRHAGPVTTMQATYVSTPGGVIAGALLFREPADHWLYLSLGLVLLALWFNMRASRDVRRG